MLHSRARVPRVLKFKESQREAVDISTKSGRRSFWPCTGNWFTTRKSFNSGLSQSIGCTCLNSFELSGFSMAISNPSSNQSAEVNVSAHKVRALRPANPRNSVLYASVRKCRVTSTQRRFQNVSKDNFFMESLQLCADQVFRPGEQGV